MIGRVHALALLLLVALTGCTSGSSAIVQTLQNVLRRDSAVAAARLNPAFRYLRVTIDDRVALLVLGNVDNHPSGAVEVWYSAEREVVRLQNGRLVGVTGLTTEWREVVLPKLPSWSILASTKEPIHWTRVRDLMPGYKFGVKDFLLVRMIPPPRGTALAALDPRNLTWFEERVEPVQYTGIASVLPGTRDPHLELPPARYAVEFRGETEIVVYGEQCLSRDVCFTWQRWPAEATADGVRK